MGYKSILRSMGASANRAAREAESQRKRQQREAERVQKKIARVEENLQKVLRVLDDEYAKGKIDKKRYNELKTRESDVGIEFLALTKAPGISLAKRYIVGKISKKEFETIQKDLLPQEFLDEQKELQRISGEMVNRLKEFKKACNDKGKNACQKCGREKAFLAPLREMEDFDLCPKCRKELSKIQKFPGFKGEFLVVSSIEFHLRDVDKKVNLNAFLNNNSY